MISNSIKITQKQGPYMLFCVFIVDFGYVFVGQVRREDIFPGMKKVI